MADVFTAPLYIAGGACLISAFFVYQAFRKFFPFLKELQLPHFNIQFMLIGTIATLALIGIALVSAATYSLFYPIF